MKLSFILSFQEILNIIEVARDYIDRNDIWLNGLKGYVQGEFYFKSKHSKFHWQSNRSYLSNYWTNWAPDQPNNWVRKEQAYRCGIVKVIDGMMITVGKRKNLFVKNLRVISDQLDTLFFFNKNTVYNTTSLRFDKRIRTC